MIIQDENRSRQTLPQILTNRHESGYTFGMGSVAHDKLCGLKQRCITSCALMWRLRLVLLTVEGIV